MHLYHHSRDPWYREPLGALPCGAALRLRLAVSGAGEGAAPFLRLWNGHEIRLPMRSLGAWDGRVMYEAVIEMPPTPTLYWYRFEVEDAGGQVRLYGNAADSLGGEGRMDNPQSFQISVYDPAFAPPAYLREGVMYQVMVDRFYRKDPTGRLFYAREDIKRHGDWYEPPILFIAPDGDNEALDFFGGTLLGIEEKLPYLRDLGVTVLYLNPIFQARSNHKYDVGDYHRIDPMFGSEEDFRSLCRSAREMGIRVLLDGVFSHVGIDSRYFNRYGRYPGLGAYQSKHSPYYSWFTFEDYPDEYVSWWGFETLPEVKELEPSYVAFTLEGPKAVVPYWLRAGASGWRLDVADELPMPYLRRLRTAAKAQREDAVLLGEVWEDASNKIAYGEQRSYVLGDTLDSVMNYPLRDALLDWALGRVSTALFIRRIESLRENYPPAFFYSTMNLIGSHDRARILNVLAGHAGDELPREQRGGIHLTEEELRGAKEKLYCLLRLLLSLPGIPCVYYGDEVGMQGAADPFCRGTFPWGREDREQQALYVRLLGLRRRSDPLKTGDLALHPLTGDALAVCRSIRGGRNLFGEPKEDGFMLLLASRSPLPTEVYLPVERLGCTALRDEDGQVLRAQDGRFSLILPPWGAMFYEGIRGEKIEEDEG